MLEITVYGSPDCPSCRVTTRQLEKRGLPYTYRDVVTMSQADRDKVALLGHRSLPIVAVGDMHWSGHRYDKINQLADMYAGAGDTAVLEDAAVEYLGSAA